ncbi:MAG: VanZ family protein [Actinomycetota bacterium]|nr:VanZ family protein [Actinomycetota bacterium]
MALDQRRQVWLDGGLALAWAIFIWILGSDSFSHSETSRILGPLLEWLFPDWSMEARRDIADVIRKLAHPVVYGVFAVLALRFVDGRQRLRFDRSPVWVACLTALAASALLATLDESRQASLSSRTGSAFDVGLDVFGAGLALAVATTAASLAGGRLLGIPGWPDDGGDAPAPPSGPPGA